MLDSKTTSKMEISLRWTGFEILLTSAIQRVLHGNKLVQCPLRNNGLLKL